LHSESFFWLGIGFAFSVGVCLGMRSEQHYIERHVRLLGAFVLDGKRYICALSDPARKPD
jgi:hypothetical protein